MPIDMTDFDSKSEDELRLVKSAKGQLILTFLQTRDKAFTAKEIQVDLAFEKPIAPSTLQRLIDKNAITKKGSYYAVA